MNLLKKAENTFWILLIGLIIIVIVYTFYNIFSSISNEFGIASVFTLGAIILYDEYHRRKQCAPM